MKANAVRLLVLAAVCTVALWPPVTSYAWETCVGQSCAFWRDVCESNGGTFTTVQNGYCLDENDNARLFWNATCTYTWREPWSLTCYGI